MDPSPQSAHRVAFEATAGEYFRIWIVNLALTIATLGIYSAWAKVRRKRYFYSKTHFDGDAFEYRGNPVAILKGRLLAAVVTAAFYAVAHFAPAYLLVMILPAIFVVPWLLVRSFAFNAYNSAWRNIRFHFHGRYWPAWRLLLGYGLLTIVTLGLGYAFLKTRLTEFVVRNHAYGATPFDVPDLKKAFFAAYARVIGLGIVASVTVAGLVFALAGVLGDIDPNSPWLYLVNATSYILYLGIFAYVRSRILNATWNQATLGSVRFQCTLRARTLWWLYLVNVLAILATLGLAAPWAVVRTYRYRAEQFAIVGEEHFGDFGRGAGGGVGASGEEIGEMLDIDFSL